jgi:Protein of unknown function DUF262
MQRLEAQERPLAKIFCGDYDFRVPNYQRPYAWEKEQAAELLDDLSEALDRDEGEPYFLGSLVLIKQPERPEADIVDGQYRLTTLTILFAILADLADDQATAGRFRALIVEPGSDRNFRTGCRAAGTRAHRLGMGLVLVFSRLGGSVSPRSWHGPIPQ